MKEHELTSSNYMMTQLSQKGAPEILKCMDVGSRLVSTDGSVVESLPPTQETQVKFLANAREHFHSCLEKW